MGTGTYRFKARLDEPGVAVPDPDGGYVESWTPLDPATWNCSIAQATARDLENLGAGTVLAQATHIVRGPYHRGMTTQTRLTVSIDGVWRTLNVVFVSNRDMRNETTDLVCSEVVH